MIKKNQIIIVLHVLGTIDIGGAENRIMDIYRGIDREKVQFYFAAHDNKNTHHKNEILELGGKVFYLPKFKGYNLLEYIKCWDNLFTNNIEIDIVHGHMTTTAFIYNYIANKKGIKNRIAHSRNSNKDTLLKKVLSKFSRFSSNLFMAVSKEAAISEFGHKIAKYKTTYFPNAVELNKFKFSYDKRNIIRKKLKIEEDFVFGHVGRFHPQKNHKFIIKLFDRLAHEIPRSKLILIGEGKLKKNIRLLISKYNLEDKVIIIDKTPQIEDYYSVFDALLFPSLYEGLPGVIVEAQANGLISFVSSNITQEVKITSAAHYIDGYDLDKWSSYINLHIPHKRINEINAMIKKGFDNKNIADNYATYYYRLLNK